MKIDWDLSDESMKPIKILLDSARKLKLIDLDPNFHC